MGTSQYALKDLTPHQLVSEIRQISEQYRAEVSTRRRTWPASIHDRVISLKRQGVGAYRVAERTGIPYTTVGLRFAVRFVWVRIHTGALHLDLDGSGPRADRNHPALRAPL